MKVNLGKKVHTFAKGREITIYIFQNVDEYSDYKVSKDAGLSRQDEQSEEFWLSFVSQIEGILLQNNVKSNGLAVGDWPINSYISIRNESFVQNCHSNSYPPDDLGWNAADQTHPFRIPGASSKNRTMRNTILLVGLLVLIFSLIQKFL
jgi:hypothetical protein